MYLYIYDAFLSQPKYASFLAGVERRVTDLDIKGKIARLNILKNTKELITDAVKAGVTTVVAIGDDQTFAKIINVIAPLQVTLGLIPAENNSKIARVLGVPPREPACDVLAARIIKRLDLGIINNYYFLNTAEITNAKISIDCDTYSVEPTTAMNVVRICNVGAFGGEVYSNPTDGILEAVITPIQQRWFSKHSLKPTILPFKKIRINAEDEDGASILTDEQVILKTPADVRIAPGQLKVIVGSNRMFE